MFSITRADQRPPPAKTETAPKPKKRRPPLPPKKLSEEALRILSFREKKKKKKNESTESTEEGSQASPKPKKVVIVKPKQQKRRKREKTKAQLEKSKDKQSTRKTVSEEQQLNSVVPWFPATTFQSAEEKQEFLASFNDGRRMFVNRVVYCEPAALRPNIIAWRQLLKKDLGIADGHQDSRDKSTWALPDVVGVVLHTMAYDDTMVDSLLRGGIPVTLFKEQFHKVDEPLLIKNEFQKFNIVHQKKTREGSFHSKLMLLEFDDRLRVVVSSANLQKFDWEQMSQVIWFQDFFPKSAEQLAGGASCEFEEYLRVFVYRQCMIGQEFQTSEVFAHEIKLQKYNFAPAAVRLVGSMQGKFYGQLYDKYGHMRLQKILQERKHL